MFQTVVYSMNLCIKLYKSIKNDTLYVLNFSLRICRPDCSLEIKDAILSSFSFLKAAVHTRYVIDACDRVQPKIILLRMVGTLFVLVVH